MPSVRLLDNQALVAADIAGMTAAWNDTATVLAARWPGGQGPPLPQLTAEQMAVRLGQRHIRTYVYDERDIGGLRVAGFGQITLHRPDFDEPVIEVDISVAGVRRQAGEAITDTRRRFRRSLVRCVARIASDLRTVEQNRGIAVAVQGTVPAVSDPDDTQYITTAHAFLAELATRSGVALTPQGPMVHLSMSPQQLADALAGMAAP